MSDDPLATRLSRFTPDASGLDRDALLFAAGRASVRPARGWVVLVGVLTASQLVTLVLFWLQAATPVAAPTTPPSRLATPRPPPADELAPADDRGAPNWANLRDETLAAEGNLPSPRPVDSPAPFKPPLHAFAVPPEFLH